MKHAPARRIDLPSALLLVLILAVACQRLLATAWTEGLAIAYPLAVGGIALGLVAGQSRFRGGIVLLLVCLYSLVVIPFTYAGAFQPGLPWLERMGLLVERLLGSLSLLAAGDSLQDAFLLMFVLTVVFWFNGIGAGYALQRHNSFHRTVLPAGMVFLLLQVFDSQRKTGALLTAVFIFLVLLLLGRMSFVRRREAWQQHHIVMTGEAASDINLIILATSLALVLAAWLLPVSTRHIPVARNLWQNMTQGWENNEFLQNLTAGLNIEERAPVNNFYGTSLPLGQDAPLSDAVLFHIQNESTITQERYYWHVRSYDTFEGGVWSSAPTGRRDVGSLTPRLELPLEHGESAKFRLLVVRTNFGVLLTPPRPIWVDVPARMDFVPVSDGVVDPIVYLPNEPVRPGEEYRVEALVMEPTQNELRAAGRNYPAWVIERYLQLPADLNPAIQILAIRLTENAGTPYDKAAAITAYLRQEIAYSNHMEPAPEGVDVLSWFLFEYKQGFCNYYATAEVILLRAAGIPARLSVGFSEGEFETPGWFSVRQRNAHAWPEVFFPGFGWVEFEPTASEPVLERPVGLPVPLPEEDKTLMPGLPAAPAQPTASADNAPENAAGGRTFPWQQTVSLSLYLLVTCLLLGIALARAATSEGVRHQLARLQAGLHQPLSVQVRGWLKHRSLPVPGWLERQARLAELDPLERAFQTIYHTLRSLHLPASPALTPAEAAQMLLVRMPEANAEIHALLDEFQPAFYGTRLADMVKVHRAAASLRQKARLRRSEASSERHRIVEKIMGENRSRHD